VLEVDEGEDDDVEVGVTLVDVESDSLVGGSSFVASSEQATSPRTITAIPALPMSFSSIRLVNRARVVIPPGYVTCRFGGA
jgi:hypothetical protein